MHRRNFLKVSAAAGLSLLSPWSRHALAAEELQGFGGPFWITINLAGAWDSTMFCDPKGDLSDGSGNGPVNHFTQAEINQLNVGGRLIPLAPGSYYNHVPAAGGAPVHVLQHLASRGVTLINGVDAGLTNHRSGEQLAMAGSTTANFPTLAALVAFNNMVDRDPVPNGPMPLLSFGGYDGTANLVPATRLSRLGVLGQITRPDVIGQNNRSGQRIHGDARQALIAAAASERAGQIPGQMLLPDQARARSQLFVARSKEQHVGRLLQQFDFSTFDELPAGKLEQQIMQQLGQPLTEWMNGLNSGMLTDAEREALSSATIDSFSGVRSKVYDEYSKLATARRANSDLQVLIEALNGAM